jgi:hypothetical protein
MPAPGISSPASLFHSTTIKSGFDGGRIEENWQGVGIGRHRQTEIGRLRVRARLDQRGNQEPALLGLGGEGREGIGHWRRGHVVVVELGGA